MAARIVTLASAGTFLLITLALAGCGAPREFTPRAMPLEEPAARAALAGLPLTATFRGEVARNGELVNTSSGYVNFTGDCREESSVEAAPGSLESQSYTRVDVVRTDGSTYARVTDDGTGEWVDARQGIGPFVTSFTPAAVAYTSDNAIGVCGLADLPMWVAGAGAGGGWDIDVERAGAYLRAVTDEHLAWMLRDPSLDDASRGNAVATFEEMRRAGAYDADYDAVLTGARIDVTADSVTYSTADGGHVQTWRFTPSPPRSVSAPPGAEPTTPALVL